MDTRQLSLILLLPATFLVFGFADWSYGLLIPILLGIYLRWGAFRDMFLKPNPTYRTVFTAFLSHVVLFSSLFLLIKGDFVIMEPSEPVLDSLFYNVDTVTTNGSVRIFPNTGMSKAYHIVNLLDSYLLFITLGFFILRNIKITPGLTS
jgi:hypothetical protein